MKNIKHFIILFIFLITNSLTYSQNEKLNVLILPSVECLKFFKCTKDNGEADYKKAIIRRELNLYSEKLRVTLNSNNPYFNVNQLESIQLDNKKSEEINSYIFKSFDLILEYDFHCQNNGGINYFTKSINFKAKDKIISSCIVSNASGGGIGGLYEDPNFLVNEMIDSEFLDKLNIKMDAVFNYFEILPLIAFNIERVKFEGKKTELNNYKSYFLFPNSQESYGDKIHKQLNGEIELTIAFDGKVYSGQYIGQYMKTKMQIFENRDKNGVIEKVETDKSSFDWPHGNGKFISNGLIIEGDWLEGKLNGHGILERKESDGKLLFKYDGNFNNNARQGKGIFSFENYYSYNGEWLNNAMDGVGKITYSQGNTYEGFWKNNLREGKGVYINNRDKNVFTKIEGNWTLNFKEGDGIIYFLNGDSLRGSVNNNIFPKYTGNGILHTNDAIYSGDFVNSEYTGKGSLEYLNGNYKKGLFLEGALQEGTVNFHYKDSTSYLGEIKNEKFDGQGTYTWADGSIFIGLFKENVTNGNGKYIGIDGTIKEGAFVNGILKSGEIRLKSGEYFKGIWDDNLVFKGESKKIASDGSIWEGEWEGEIPISQGKVFFSNGDIYEGSWSGRIIANYIYYDISGFGKITYKNKEEYEGEFEYAKRTGEGVFKYKNGNKYLGSWNNDLPNGAGKLIFANGDIYEGNFIDEVRTGYGEMIYKNKSIYDGNWENNIQSGKGKFIDVNGKISEGEFKNGKYLEPAKLSSVVIGNLVWTNYNLNVDKFRNGDLITQAKSFKEWSDASAQQKPCWCYYKFNASYGQIYGKMYNWYAVDDPRGLAPFGWHVGTQYDYTDLLSHCRTNGTIGFEIRLKNGNDLKSKTGWKSKLGTDALGFSALSGGSMFISEGYSGHYNYGLDRWSFADIEWDTGTDFWTSTHNDLDFASSATHFQLDSDEYCSLRDNEFKGIGMYVRCVKD